LYAWFLAQAGKEGEGFIWLANVNKCLTGNGKDLPQVEPFQLDCIHEDRRVTI